MVFHLRGWVTLAVFMGIFVYLAIRRGTHLDPEAIMIMGGVAAAVVLSIVGYHVARALKGSLKLQLNQKHAVSGETITGTLDLVTKKPIHADRMYVALVGEREERRTRRTSKGSTTSMKWVEFYREETDLLLGEDLYAGFRQSYPITLAAPSEDSVMNSSQVLGKVADAMEDGLGKTLLQGVGSLANLTGGRKRWHVEARLETKGVDLAAKKKLHVSLRQG